MDTRALKENILSFNKQLSFENISVYKKEKLRGINPKEIIIIGMGGSSLSGGLLRGFFPNSDIRFTNHTNYGLPQFIDKKTSLLIFNSFSGETEETLSGIEEAHKNGLHIGIVTSGGRLEKIAKQKNIPYALFPKDNLTPREAVGYNLFSVISLLSVCCPLIRMSPFTETINPRKTENKGRALANEIAGKTAVLYSDNRLSGLLNIWKIFIAETGKQFSAIGEIPEMNHDELEAVPGKKSLVPVFIETGTESKEIKLRGKISKGLMEKFGTKTVTIKLEGKNFEEKIWNGITLIMWTTLFLNSRGRGVKKDRNIISLFKLKMKNQKKS